MSNRRRERERRRRLAHAEVAPRDESAPRPERAPRQGRSGSLPKAPRKAVPAPSLQRSLKRGALVLVVLSALIYIVDKGKHSIGADVLQASLGAIFFVPFDFLLTRVMFNRVGKRFNS